MSAEHQEIWKAHELKLCSDRIAELERSLSEAEAQAKRATFACAGYREALEKERAHFDGLKRELCGLCSPEARSWVVVYTVAGYGDQVAGPWASKEEAEVQMSDIAGFQGVAGARVEELTRAVVGAPPCCSAPVRDVPR